MIKMPPYLSKCIFLVKWEENNLLTKTNFAFQTNAVLQEISSQINML